MKVDKHDNQDYISIISSGAHKKTQLEKNIDKLKPKVRKIISRKDSVN